MVTVKPLTVHWHHDSAPIYSAAFQPGDYPLPVNHSARFATGGGDNNVRVWRLKTPAELDEPPQVEYLATLAKHEGAVNAVRFNKQGTALASAGDDGVVCLWVPTNQDRATQFGNDFEDLETWRILKKCRSASFGEIYDLAWSPSGRFLAATSMDKVVSILDTVEGTCVAALRDHKHYVQGVAWDPRGEFLATQSSDQSVLIYRIKNTNDKIQLGQPMLRMERTEFGDKLLQFHSESFSSFFRRLSFSPDGSLLVVPAGLIKEKKDKETKATTNEPENVAAEKTAFPTPQEINSAESTKMDLDAKPEAKAETDGDIKSDVLNCVFIYARGNFKQPQAMLPLPKESLAVHFNPVAFTLRGENPVVKLPYRLVYAVATLNGVFLYDTERLVPLGMMGNLHYSSITDLAWSPDGRMLLITSIDGFCSVLRLDKEELGTPYEGTVGTQVEETALKIEVPTETPQINTLAVRKKSKLPVEGQKNAGSDKSETSIAIGSASGPHSS